MGSIISRRPAGNDDPENASVNAYRYPPRCGNYFGNYFILGGERFDSAQPEMYLFGENGDLNFLGSHPVPFPYPPPDAGDPINPLRCVVNIRRESVKLVRITRHRKPLYNIEFVFDTDVRCSIVIHYLCTEEVSSSGIRYIPKDPSTSSPIYYHRRGANQLFYQPSHIFNPALYSDEELLYGIEKNIYPIVIHCMALDTVDDMQQSQVTIGIVGRQTDGSYVFKSLKQKLFVDGLCYLLQDIYGIENKAEFHKEINNDNADDVGLECVVCMSEMRDTLILPCRHLCLCQSCADSLRYQASSCPICRSPFRALIRIKAVRRSKNANIPSRSPEILSGSENVPAGYERVSLIEALNGPIYRRRFSALDPLVDSPDVNLHRRHGHLHKERSSRRSSERHLRSTKYRNASCPCHRDSRDIRTSEHSSLTSKRTNVEHKDEERRQAHVHYLHGKPLMYAKDRVCSSNDMSDVTEEVQDEDSEAEKLSPLLESVVTVNTVPPLNVATENNIQIDTTQVISLGMEPDSDDDVVTVQILHPNYKKVEYGGERRRYCEQPCSSSRLKARSRASLKQTDDSDYYTPEEPATTIVNTLNLEKGKESLPGTPASLASVRSSADSYTSSSSSRHLLSHHEKTSVG